MYRGQKITLTSKFPPKLNGPCYHLANREYAFVSGVEVLKSIENTKLGKTILGDLLNSIGDAENEKLPKALTPMRCDQKVIRLFAHAYSHRAYFRYYPEFTISNDFSQLMSVFFLRTTKDTVWAPITYPQ